MSNKDNSDETWAQIPGFGGRYEVSSQGQIRSYANSDDGEILSQSIDTNGYPKVNLYHTEAGRHTFSVHKIVANVFLPSPPPLPDHIRRYIQVNHIDNDKTNNSVENLEWVSAKNNIAHAIQNGWSPGRNGEENGRSKLTRKKVKWCRCAYAAHSNVTQKSLAKATGVCQSVMGKAISNRKWDHVHSITTD